MPAGQRKTLGVSSSYIPSISLFYIAIRVESSQIKRDRLLTHRLQPLCTLCPTPDRFHTNDEIPSCFPQLAYSFRINRFGRDEAYCLEVARSGMEFA